MNFIKDVFVLASCLQNFIPVIPYGMQAYRAAHFKHNASMAPISKKIKSELYPLFKTMGVREDVIVQELPTLSVHLTEIQGTHFFTQSDAVIYLSPRYYEIDQEGCRFFVKHEIAHLKQGDFFIRHMLAVISSSVIAAFFPRNAASLLSVMFTAYMTQALFIHCAEGVADDFAIAESSIAELKGAKRTLMVIRQLGNREAGAELGSFFSVVEPTVTFLRKLTFPRNAGELSEVQHPSLTSRIEKIEHALEARHTQIDQDEEQQKMLRLKKLIVESNGR